MRKQVLAQHGSSGTSRCADVLVSFSKPYCWAVEHAWLDVEATAVTGDVLGREERQRQLLKHSNNVKAYLW